jgi:hypothetical protein
VAGDFASSEDSASTGSPGSLAAAGPPEAESALTVPIGPVPPPAPPGGDGSRRTRSRTRRPAPAPLRPPAGPGRPQPRRMRGLLVTPWFAAGAGFVIAAALALNSPHTVLTYRPNTVPCNGCAQPGALPTLRPGVQTKTARPAHVARPAIKARHGTALAAGPAVGYRVVWQRDGAFAAIVTIPAAQARGGWSLQFSFPGRHITQVWGALWQPDSSGEGGLATVLEPPRHSGPPGDSGTGQSGPPGQDGQPGSGYPGQHDPEDLRFLVTAQGSPVTPAGCVLNHVVCHFS